MARSSSVRSIHPLHRELFIFGGLGLGFLALMSTVLLWAPSTPDREIERAVQGIPWNQWSFIPRLGSDLGGGVYGTLVAPALAGTWFAATRRWKLLVLLAGVFVLHYLLISPKLFITAYRPSPVFGVEGAGGLESFPSGHVQWATSFYGLMAFVALGYAKDWRMRTAIIGGYALIVVFTMIGRMELGRHWPVDTVAGVLAGLIALRLLVRFHHWRLPDRFGHTLRRRGSSGGELIAVVAPEMAGLDA